MSTLILPSTQHQQHKRNSARKVPMGVTNPDKVLGWSDKALFAIFENRHLQYAAYYICKSPVSKNRRIGPHVRQSFHFLNNHRDLKNEYFF